MSPISDFTNDVNINSRFSIDDYIINTTYLSQDTYQIKSIRPIRDRVTDDIIGHLYFSKPIGRDAECIFGIFPHDPYDWILAQQA